jgi:hypothetical protein
VKLTEVGYLLREYMRANKKNLKEEPKSKPDVLQQVHKNFKTLKEEPSSKTEV